MKKPAVYVVLCTQAARALVRQKARSGLTALGIAIGIAATVWVVAIGQSGSAHAEKLLADLGNNLVWVEAGSRNVAGVKTGTRSSNTLTMADAEAIARDIDLVDKISPNIDGKVVTVSSQSNWMTSYRGVTPAYFSIKRWDIVAGDAFTDEDVDRGRNVCLLGDTVRARLFGEEAALGRIIRVNAQPFEVIGILGKKGQSGTGQDQDDTLIVPYTTAQRKIRSASQTWLDDILISAVSPDAVAPVAAKIADLIRERHRIGPAQDDDFNIRHPEELIKAQLDASRTFAFLLITIASVSLLVGGIGIMNVMLASVTERTREIGVRMSVGARSNAIAFQFLAEATMLCVFGGLLGVVGSFVGSSAIGRALGWRLTVSPDAILLAMAFSALVGIVFGYLPARRASRMDPIEALRSD